MKKLMMLVFALMSTAAFAKSVKGSELPAAVSESFAKANPQATHVKWDKEDSYYEASYIVNGRNGLAIYNSKGELLETDTEMKWEEFPVEVQTSIKELGASKYYFWYQTVDANQQTQYGIWYKRDHCQFNTILSPNGSLNEQRQLTQGHWNLNK